MIRSAASSFVMRLVAAGVPEPAIEARTLADLGQAREAAEAAQTPVDTGAARHPAPPAGRHASYAASADRRRARGRPEPQPPPRTIGLYGLYE